VAIWAHPFWDIESPKRVLAALDDFVALGLDGVEAFYATFTRKQTLRLVDAAADRDLLTTGSADFHGPAHRMFSRFRAFQLYGQTPRLGPIGA
jgi:predicted metal-dependent phosphoesterase TrpH